MSAPFDDQFDPVVENTGEYARVDALAGHLLIIFPIGYIEDSPTRFSVPGKRSDAIVLDVIDLDDFDEHGQPGKLYRNNWWRGAQLIMMLKARIGGKVLGRIGKGTPKNGMNPPWVINDASRDEEGLVRARAWGHAHGDFITSPFAPPRPAPAPSYGQPQGGAPQYGQSSYSQQPPQNYSQPAPQAAPRFPVPQTQFPPQGYDQQPPQNGGYQQGPPPGYGQQPQGGYPQSSPQGPPPPSQEELDMLAQMRARRHDNPYPQTGYSQDPPF